MRKDIFLRHKFVEYIPSKLEDGVIYISIPFATVVHSCVCGCGKEVVTPLTPTDWKLIFDGETITLDPSIGNWSFKCKSHYWIRRNKIIWSGTLPKESVKAIRTQDQVNKQQYYGAKSSAEENAAKHIKHKERQSFWQKLLSWWS